LHARAPEDVSVLRVGEHDMERMKMSPQEIEEKAKNAVKETIENVKDRYDSLKDTIQEYRSKDFSEVMDNIKGFAREHPVPMILGALFLGFGIGRRLTRKND
jgi:hypothetical protein